MCGNSTTNAVLPCVPSGESKVLTFDMIKIKDWRLKVKRLPLLLVSP